MAYGAILGKKNITQAQLNNAAPYNWLDNSDFTNLVAQAGINGKHGTTTYMADRWIVTGGTPSYTEGTGVSFNGSIVQKLEFAPSGGVTVVAGTSEGIITSNDIPANIKVQLSYGQGNQVTIDSNGQATIQWVALYEGTYSVATAPAYHPKGYANELAICQRYYIRYRNYYKYAMAGILTNANTAVFPFYFPVAMRTQPTCDVVSSLNLFKVRVTNVASVTSLSGTSSSTLSIQFSAGLSSSYTAGDCACLYMDSGATIDFYADL